MCNYTTLYQDKIAGYIIHCLDCNNIQLGFGNLAITFTIPAFNDFYQSIKMIDAEQHLSPDPFHKNISLSTPCDGMKILLSPNELHQLNGMLDIAETELRSQELISLFNHR
jgi:hypothetical protein